MSVNNNSAFAEALVHKRPTATKHSSAKCKEVLDSHIIYTAESPNPIMVMSELGYGFFKYYCYYSENNAIPLASPLNL